MTDAKPIDTSASERNVKVKASLSRELEIALTAAMQRGFWGEISVAIPFQDGIAQQGRIEVRQHTPIL